MINLNLLNSCSSSEERVRLLRLCIMGMFGFLGSLRIKNDLVYCI